MKKFLRLAALVAVLTIALAAYSLSQSGEGTAETKSKVTAEIGKAAPNFKLTGSDGKEYSLADYKGKWVVLEWTNFLCPFVRKHYDSKNMQKLQLAYTKREVAWFSICSSAPGKQGFYSGEELTGKVKSEGSNATAYLVDADGTVGKTYGAKTTPHMFIINPRGVLVYAGAIDDKPSVRLADIEGAANFVTLALEAGLAKKEIVVSSTVSYGCSVKY